MSDSDPAASAADYAPVEIDFTPKPSFTTLFDGMNVEEELGRPFTITMEISTGDVKADPTTLVGTTCSIWLYEDKNTDDQNRYFHAIVTSVNAAGVTGGAYRFKLVLRPWVWLLSQSMDCKIFNKMSAFQVVTKVFRDAGYSDFQDKRQSSAGDTVMDYCVQYKESSLDFVTRLMELYGFYYYFIFDKTSHTMVLVDDPNAHGQLDTPLSYQYDQTEFRHVKDHVWDWSAAHDLLTGKWTHSDYNFTTPSADLTSKTVQTPSHDHHDHEIYEYPGIYDDMSGGQNLADVRMQAVSIRRVISSGQSNSRALLCGWRFTLKDHPNPAFNAQYLVIKSVTTVSGVEGTPNPNAETLDTYRVQFQCVPVDKPFRLERKTARPMIRGAQTAKVVGSAGEEITTNEYGQIKVKFHWDRSDTQDDERTCWIRCAHASAGGSYGSIHIPRVGHEVLVTFLEGNPDRPMVTGVVYNANNQVPNGLPGNKTQSGIRTNSSPGGGGSNELRFEDKKGAEEVYMHAQYDMKTEVKHDQTLTVENDRSATITTGNDSLTVSAGNHKIDVSAGTSAITAAQSITLTVGGNSLKIDQSGITINGIKIDLSGSATISLTAPSISIN